MIRLTNQDGLLIWVKAEDISIVRREVKNTESGAISHKTKLTIGKHDLFVREAPGEVLTKIEVAGKPVETRDQAETYAPEWCRRGQGMCIGKTGGECGIKVTDPRTCEEIIKETEEEGKKRGLVS